MPSRWPLKNPEGVTPALKSEISPGSRQWGQLVTEGAGELGIEISNTQIEKLACHATELLKWNKKINLTRIDDPVEMAVKHYVDSLACVPYVPDGANVLDIGTGGGFPGVPLAVAAKPGKVLMIDSVRKKISFLQQAIRLMKLYNSEARHVRAQELKDQSDYGEFFDIVVCRALSGIDHIIELAFPLLKDGGVIVALKGRAGQAEKECRWHVKKTDTVQRTSKIRTVEYRLPVLNVERSLVLIEK